MVGCGWPMVNWKCIKILFKETGRSCCLSVVCLVYFCLMKWFCISRPEWANKKRTEQDVSLQGTDTWPWFLKPVDSEALLKFLKLVSSCLSNCKFAATTILEEEEEILSFFLVLSPNIVCGHFGQCNSGHCGHYMDTETRAYLLSSLAEPQSPENMLSTRELGKTNFKKIKRAQLSS